MPLKYKSPSFNELLISSPYWANFELFLSDLQELAKVANHFKI